VLRTRRDDVGWRLSAGAVLFVPLIAVPNGLEPFRTPKELVLRAMGMLLLVLWTWRAFDRRARREKLSRLHITLLVSIGGWAVVSSLFASHKIHAAFALLWIFTGLLLFVTTFHAVQDRSVNAVAAVVLAAPLINAILAIAEVAFDWYPFVITSHPGRAIGLQGNANDLGALLAPATVFAVSVAIAVPRLRWPALTCAVVLGAGIIASQTMTSTIAVIAGIGAAALVDLGSARRGLLAAAAVAVLVALLAFTYSPLRARITAAATRMQAGQLDAAMSNRLTPWLVAWRMSVSDPVTGVGPGGYAWDYFPFKIEAEQRYFRLLGLDRLDPGFSRYASTINYGEAHNEFLEVLAEAGWPALVILIAVLVAIASTSRRPDSSDERATVARYLGAPFVVTTTVSFAGGFPLQLAGSYVPLIFIAATCVAWARTR
jgi:O-antigen ligase